MKTFQNICLAGLAVLGMAAISGCSSSPSTSSNANPSGNPVANFKSFNPDTAPGASGLQEFAVFDTTPVGKPVWVSSPDAVAVVQLNGTPWPAKTVLAGLDENHHVTAVLVATDFYRHQFQGFTVLTGQLKENDTVVNPGRDDATAMINDIKSYMSEHTASAPANIQNETSPSTTIQTGTTI